VKLDIARNKLLTAGTIMALISACLSFGAVVTGLFGMNLENDHSGSHGWFVGIAVSLLIVCTSSFALCMYVLYDKGLFVS
jgi:Mg2+ and Co2+ transporter CorA